MADQKRWFKVWTSILANGKFAEMDLSDIGRWTLLGAAAALDGDSGVLGVPGQGKELCRILRVGSIEDAKVVLKRIESVTLEEMKNRDGEHSVTWKNWHKYQEDSTAAQRMKTLRSKRRGEEKRREKKKPLPILPSQDEIKIITLLNELAGTEWEPGLTYGENLRARLTGGATVADLESIVRAKVSEWSGNPEMAKNLNPETLFRPKHYARYLAEAKQRAKGTGTGRDPYALFPRYGGKGEKPQDAKA